MVKKKNDDEGIQIRHESNKNIIYQTNKEENQLENLEKIYYN